MNIKNSLGKKVSLIFLHCEKEICESKEELDMILEEASKIAGAKVVKTVFYEFKPVGLTLVKVLAESHIVLHTYPLPEERRSIVIDIFTCGDEANPEAPIEFLKVSLGAKEAYRGNNVEYNPDAPGWFRC